MNSKEVEDGQAVYSKFVLSIYDLWVLWISNRFIWKCPTYKLLEFFNKYVTTNHLDIGVGSGYFLDHCRFPSGTIRLGLMDLNRNSLEVTGKRVNRYKPEMYRLNVLETIGQEIEPFDSISLNYLFHCLPGRLSEKLVVLDNVDHLLNDNGIVFGSTILQQGVKRSCFAKQLMNLYNRKGVFCNKLDDIEDLNQFLLKKYTSCQIIVEGCVDLFWESNLKK